MVHLTDMAFRYDLELVPILNSGGMVLADRYHYTPITRDTVRGIPLNFIENAYSFLKTPNITILLDVPVEVSIKRRSFNKNRIWRFGFYKEEFDGVDEPFDENGYAEYLNKLREEYLRLAAKDNNTFIIDGTLPIEEVLNQSINIINQYMEKTSNRPKI